MCGSSGPRGELADHRPRRGCRRDDRLRSCMHRNARVSQATADALLAVDPARPGLARVDANGAMLRLRSLQAMGHGSARVARAIGCHEQSIQRVVNGRRPDDQRPSCIGPLWPSLRPGGTRRRPSKPAK